MMRVGPGRGLDCISGPVVEGVGASHYVNVSRLAGVLPLVAVLVALASLYNLVLSHFPEYRKLHLKKEREMISLKFI